jgi:hypothetical protein
MKFINEITIDWYDNILKSFCKGADNITYYCCILALDHITDQKVYLCVNIKYLLGSKELKEIIQSNSFKENWERLPMLIDLSDDNETYLIKSKDLRTDEIELLKYKNNFNFSQDILFGEYPEVLDQAAKIDNWWSYF